jgi:hypothetical protein
MAVDLHSRLPFQFTTLTRTTRPWPIVQGTFDVPQTQARAVQMWAGIGEQLRIYINGEKAKSKPEEAKIKRWEAQLKAHGTTTEQGRVLAEKREQEEDDEDDEDDDDGEDDEDEDEDD